MNICSFKALGLWLVVAAVIHTTKHENRNIVLTILACALFLTSKGKTVSTSPERLLIGAVEMAQWLRARVALAEDLGSFVGTNIMVHEYP